MTVGVLKESESENRVALLPAEVATLKKMGIEVLMELNAGSRAFAADSDYLSAGARLAERKDVISGADVLITINPPVHDNINSFREGQVICSVLNPVVNSEWLDKARLAWSVRSCS